MSETEMLEVLEAENQRLKRDNDKLLEIVVQLRVTLNRLIERYVKED